MKNTIPDNIAITVSKSDCLELPAEILEFSIDQVLDEGLFKDIPVVGWVIKGLSIKQSISDRMFHHKILRFLYALQEIGKRDRIKFREKIENNKEYRKKVGEHLLLLIDKIDAFDKSCLLAICFDHFLTGDIDHDYFIDLSHVIERTPLSDLKALSMPDNKQIIFGSTGVAAACGILEYGISEPDYEGELPSLGTKLSLYGRDLRDMFRDRYRERIIKEKQRTEHFLKAFENPTT